MSRPSNTVTLIGRLTKDVDLRYSEGEKQTAIARFTIAVDRGKKDANGNRQSDFPNCIAFGSTAENIQRFFQKGSRLAVSGSLQTGKYQNREGQTVYTTDVVVDGFDFVESKGSSEQNPNRPVYEGQRGYDNYQPNNSRGNAPRGGYGGSERFKNESQPIGDGFMSVPDSPDAEGLPWN